MTRTLYARLLWAMTLLIGCVVIAGPAAAKACETNCLAPGDYDLSMVSGKYIRLYTVHVPASYSNARPAALLLDIHGHGLTNTNQRDQSGQLAQSDKRGFIAVWPQGIANSWNGNGCCTVAYDLNIDDVGFLRQIIGEITARANIDPAKIYATGWSNGAGMSQRLACEAADLVRAIAPVAHPLNRNDCKPVRPVGVLAFHGTEDTVIPYYGGGDVLPRNVLGVPLGWQGAENSLNAWKGILDCAKLKPVQLAGGSNDQTYLACRGGVTAGLVSVANGQHNLYTASDTTGALGVTKPIGYVDVAEYMWTHLFRP